MEIIPQAGRILKENGGEKHMDGQVKKPVDGCDGKGIFEHGNVRIIISEHFSDKGKSFENIIEDSIIREVKNGRDCIMPSAGTGG